MQVCPLGTHHAAAYRQLMLEAYEKAADAFTSTLEERALEPLSWWVRRIADPTGLSIAFGAFDEGAALVGTVALEFSAKPKTRHKGLVIGMYVQPQARGSGASRALMSAALAAAAQRPDLHLLTLTVTQGNVPAIRLYEAFGFAAFGTEPMAILTPSGYQAKVHMWRPLDQRAPAPLTSNASPP